MSELIREEVTITCSDDYQLTGTLFKPSHSPKAAVMFGPATGIKRGFYTSLASYLVEQGFAALTFDNRGIGDSLQGSVKSSSASLVEWGQLDMTAALDSLKQWVPDTSYHLIGHSAGGQLVGLMQNAHELSSQFNFACSSGQMKLMPFPYKLVARFFMHVFMPVSNRVFGYARNDWMGMGEPLPRRVAEQWTQWCAGQGYVKTAFGKTIKEHQYDSLNFPSKWVIASDDNIATVATMDDMLSVMPNLQVEKLVLHPADLGKKEIGHMGFFSRRNADLWYLLIEWLQRYS